MNCCFGGVLVVAGMLCAAAGSASSDEHATKLETFRQLRAEGIAALKAGDGATAEVRLGAALKIYPCNPAAVLAFAQAAQSRADWTEAEDALRGYARVGNVLPSAADGKFDPSLKRAAAKDIVRALAHNRAVVGRAEIVFQTAPEPIIVEKIVFDPTGQLLVGTVHRPGVFRVVKGRLASFAEANSVAGVFGMAADPGRNDLWVASSAADTVLRAPHAGSALIQLDLRTGRRKAIYRLPRDGPQQWGDLALGRDGTVYASDGISGEIWRLRPGATRLELLLKAGTLGSPQGMVESPDGRNLIVADYTTGLHVVDIATAAEKELSVPADVCAVGTDGLLASGDYLYAVENGVPPDRILRLKMNRDWSEVVESTVIRANGPSFDGPTSGTVHDGFYYFVSRSQWSDFDDDGRPKRDASAPAVIARIRMSP